MLRRQAMLPDTLAHISLAGVALGIVIKITPEWTAMAVALIGAVMMEWLRRSYKSYSEISVAILMTGGLSVAVLLMSMQHSINKGFTAYLFGSIVAVTQEALYVMTGITVIGLFLIWWYRRPLYLMTFDEDCAQTSGVPVRGLSIAFNILAGMVVATMIPITGVLMVSALVILPAALATKLGRSFGQTILIAMTIGVFGVFSGLFSSYELNTPSGASIAFILLLTLICGLGLMRLLKYLKRRRNEFEQSFTIQPTVSVPQPISANEHLKES